MLGKFRSARDKHLPVHDVDLQRWTLSQVKLADLDNFTASHPSLLNFKKRNGTSSRKAVKFISHREVMDKSTIEKAGQNFVAEATSLLPKYRLESVLKVDQSSFHYEIASNRTLSYVGEKASIYQ